MHVSKWALPTWLVITVLSIPGFSATPDRIAGALNSHQTVTLRGYVQRKAVPKNDLGTADPQLRFGSIMLLTSPTASQQQALTHLLAEQQDRKSRDYHKWLTPEQWAGRFGLSPNDVQKITNWLGDQGFTGIQVARGRNWIICSGTAAQIQRSFGTEIHQYMVNGELHVANATSPKIPAALSGIVTGIRGLDDFHLKPRTRLGVHPDYSSSRLGQNIAPGDIATIYDINPLYTSSPSIDGTGQKLAVIGQTDIYLNDINYFRSGFSLSTVTCTTNSSNVITACSDPHFKYVVANSLSDPGVPLTTGDLSEADLDLELSGAVARGAQIVYVNAPATFSGGNLVSGGVWVGWHWAIDNDVAPVISLSYGNCEFGFPYSVQGSSDETELQKANSLGITFVNSSGDSGAAECDPNSTDSNGASATGGYGVSYPASSPEVTGVGGNSLSLTNIGSSTYWGTTNGTDGGSALSYVPEQGWNDDNEIGQYCQANPTNSFCVNGGGKTGWVAITNQQTAQKDIGISSTGGGPSNCAVQTAGLTDCVSGFAQPSWQTVTLSGQASVRFTPDVSFLASPNFPGYLFCTAQSELGDSGGATSSCSPGGAAGISNAIGLSPGVSVIGGTSAAAPLFAGIVALLNQSLSQTGLGNVNQTLYQLASDTSNGAFHQVTTGTNTVYCTAGTPGSAVTSINCPSAGILGFDASTQHDATTGYNLVSGLGSVDVNNLVLAWAASLNGFGMSSSAINPTTAPAGTSVTATITVAPSNGSSFSGTVTLGCANQTGISCSFNPTTVTNGSGSTIVTVTVAPNLAAGPATVTVTGTSGSLSANTAVNFTVTATTETFTLSSNLGTGGTLSVKQGAAGQVNLTVASTSTPSFVTTTSGNSTTNLPLTYSCSALPSLSNCTFSPTSPNQSTAVTVNITTTAPTHALARPLDGGAQIFYAALLPGLFGIVLIGGSRRRALRGIRMLGLITVLGMSTMWLASCGGSNNSSTGSPGTPVGSYTVSVTATTGGSAQISNSYQFTLSVTQ